MSLFDTPKHFHVCNLTVLLITSLIRNLVQVQNTLPSFTNVYLRIHTKSVGCPSVEGRPTNAKNTFYIMLCTLSHHTSVEEPSVFYVFPVWTLTLEHEQQHLQHN
ncbi:hypothetical protein PoB_002819200 [Plakobranchus ocellatus]|uniref:Secreted protein n=1 Tax=Plakobranchus ocellatus TaxID=259542 RepID=A0AAV4A2Y8_9GAST|nr:hypothetical protein PoB_002819200 [Plakobranchus ocellatus]